MAAYLESRYQQLHGAVLVIHTKNNGEISEAASGKSKEELERLPRLSREIDHPENPYKAIVSVMVLRERWDVQNVVSVVGLRPFKAKSQILPEQTLGRGLRRMFRGEPVQEKVSVIGTGAFIDFFESIKVEGVELEYAEMGDQSKPKSPVVVEVDRENEKKDIDALDIGLPILSPRLYREYKNLELLDPAALPHSKITAKAFSLEEQREIIFKDIDIEAISHTTVMDSVFEPNYQSVIGYFAKTLMRDLRLIGGFDVLFGKLKTFIEGELFTQPVSLEDPNILRNLSELEAIRTIIETFKAAINTLTAQDRGTTEIRDFIKLSKTRPFIVNDQGYLVPKKSIFNKIIGDNRFELEFAAFLDGCDDILSFIKNSQSTSSKLEYRTTDGSISNYYPDFIVKETDSALWIIETKGREDLDDLEKLDRLQQWCADSSAQDPARQYRSLYVRQEQWEKYRPKGFSELKRTFFKEP